MDLSPFSFFEARSHGLKINSSCLERVPEEESEIIRFIRTPEGKGVGALRARDGGETWQIHERGTKLERSGSWDQADFVVVLAQGQQTTKFAPLSNLMTYRPSIRHLFKEFWYLEIIHIPSSNDRHPRSGVSFYNAIPIKL